MRLVRTLRNGIRMNVETESVAIRAWASGRLVFVELTDGRQIAFTSDQRGPLTTYQVPADGSAPPRRLLTMSTSVDEAVYTRDGRWLVFRTGSGGGRNISAMRTGTDSAPRALVATSPRSAPRT